MAYTLRLHFLALFLHFRLHFLHLFLHFFLRTFHPIPWYPPDDEDELDDDEPGLSSVTSRKIGEDDDRIAIPP